NSSRGACMDPMIESFGDLVLLKTIDHADVLSDTFLVSLPAGPGARRPEDPLAPLMPGGFAAVPTGPQPVRSCPIAGETQLSAGTLSIQADSGASVNIEPAPDLTLAYRQDLPAGFIGRGTYRVTGGAGDFTFKQQIEIPERIRFGATSWWSDIGAPL